MQAETPNNELLSLNNASENGNKTTQSAEDYKSKQENFLSEMGKTLIKDANNLSSDALAELKNLYEKGKVSLETIAEYANWDTIVELVKGSYKYNPATKPIYDIVGKISDFYKDTFNSSEEDKTEKSNRAEEDDGYGDTWMDENGNLYV